MALGECAVCIFEESCCHISIFHWCSEGHPRNEGGLIQSLFFVGESSSLNTFGMFRQSTPHAETSKLNF